MTNPTTVLITGNTYPHRDALRAMGGQWDPASKGWRVPLAQVEKARALVGVASTTQTVRRGIRTSSGLCTVCGDDCGGTQYRCGYQ